MNDLTRSFIRNAKSEIEVAREKLRDAESRSSLSGAEIVALRDKLKNALVFLSAALDEGEVR